MPVRVVVGFDGSPQAAAALETAAALFPGAHAWIAYLWAPPFASDAVRRRLWERAADVNDMIALVEREGELEARRLTAMGVTLAGAAGWQAEPLLQRSWAAEGAALAQSAETVGADLVVVGSRGLGGSDALLGSVSDMVVHYCRRPVLVVPHPMLSAERDAAGSGPVIVGWDGSAGSEAAYVSARSLFPTRRIVAVSVGEEAEPAPPDADSDPLASYITVDRGRGFRHRSVANALLEAASEHDAAAIVVGSRGRSAARELLIGSVAMGTLHHSHRPVMVVASPPGPSAPD